MCGRDVFCVTAGDPGDEPLVLLHGYPTSSWDFQKVLGRLAEEFFVVAHDHLGFGLSDKPENYSYSLMEQTDVALMLWRKLGIERAHVLAHDYGTSIATELLARRERGLLDLEIESLRLCNGSIHVELADMSLLQRALAVPRLGDVVARFASETTFVGQLRRIGGSRGEISREELSLMWELLTHNDGRARIPQIARYQDERRRFWHRWIGALERLDLPTHVVWGREDAVAVEAIARQLAAEIPGAELTWLEGLGHYPMVERPDEWAGAVTGFWEG